MGDSTRNIRYETFDVGGDVPGRGLEGGWRIVSSDVALHSVFLFLPLSILRKLSGTFSQRQNPARVAERYPAEMRLVEMLWMADTASG